MKNLLVYPGCYNEGYTACQQFMGDENMISNPYKSGTGEAKAWANGWAEALCRLPVFSY